MPEYAIARHSAGDVLVLVTFISLCNLNPPESTLIDIFFVCALLDEQSCVLNSSSHVPQVK